ncbi:MAG: DUF402 domain-containing protein [Gemmatimonadetes bacterium]|jgi:predicted RNA-binding protein associated with RNAse of E/G family|nr:DUF402 domain-containing protein [Gemmatimonadota bacterium]
MRDITIRSRSGEHKAFTDGIVAAFDDFGGEQKHDLRKYVFLEENIQLVYDPFWLSKKESSAKQWYADLIHVEWITDSLIEITDLYLDIIIEENGPTYRMIDFDDLADALAHDKVDTQILSNALRGLQTFLDNHLHFGKDFPPEIIKPFLPNS